jgi:rfaE bifunctional protein kinase chain/domain
MIKNFIPTKEAISACRILVVGDVMLDRYWFGEVVRISPEAPVPVLLVKREEDRLGGAANVALNLKNLGGQVTLISMVGHDECGLRLADLLQINGVTSLLSKDHRLQTIVKLRLIGGSQQMLRADFEKEPSREILSQILVDFERELPLHDAVLFSDYGKGGLSNVTLMIQIARSLGKLVIVDPKGADYSKYSGATVITPNLAELQQVVGPWLDDLDLSNKVEVLRAKLGLKALLLTKSDKGMSLFQENSIKNLKAQVREVADVTGAGDTVIATLALMLACGLSIEIAMEISNCAGGIVVSKFGTSTLNYEDLFV